MITIFDCNAECRYAECRFMLCVFIVILKCCYAGCCYTECHYADFCLGAYHYADFCLALCLMQSVVMLNVAAPNTSVYFATGCVHSDHCPWGMFCNMTTKTCDYKLCPNQLANGTLAYESFSSYTGVVNTLGHTAVARCQRYKTVFLRH